jgi:PAS domain S-box-containing protein
MKINLKLSQKGLLLIAVPLMFELAFVWLLVSTLHELEREYRVEGHRRDVLMHVNGELNTILESATAMGMYQLEHDDRYKKQFEACIFKLKNERTALEQAVTDSQIQDQEELTSFNSKLIDVVNTLDQSKDLMQTGDRIDTMRGLVRVRKLLNILRTSGSKIIEDQETIHASDRATQARLRDQIEWIIKIGVIVSIALAAVLVSVFNRGTSMRLRVLLDNTMNLAMQKPLLKQLTGTDEIAQIDRTFHSMAESLDEARSKEEALTANAADVICSLDENIRFTKVNPAAKRSWGYDDDELLGRSILTLLDNADTERVRHALEEIRLGKSNSPIEMRVRRKDNSQCDSLWSAQWSAQAKSLFCVAHDISERKQLERLKQEVVAMVSHDLRSPLTAMQSLLELLQAGVLGQLNEKGIRKIEMASQVLQRLISMINDLLDMERLEAGMFDLEMRHRELYKLVECSFDAVRTMADTNSIELKWDADEVFVYCDEDRIIRVLVNLLSNAIKFSPAGSQVTVSASADEEWVEVRVSDHGRGIPAEKLKAIFERYKQIDRTDEKVGGSGLGLAICKAIVDAHKGTSGVESVLGEGSTFWFKLPMRSGI